MMRNALALVVALGVSAWAQGAAPAPEKKPETPKKEVKAAKAHETRFMGMVESVDAAAGKLSVKDKAGKTMSFSVGTAAKVMKAGKKGAALSDVMAGDHVTVMYEGTAEAPMVKAVKVMPHKEHKGKAEPQEKAAH